jgi:hypothetical protein
MTPKSGVRFSDKITRKKQGSGAPKSALSNHVRTDRQVCETRLCAAACRAARRLSALTLAALATGYPDGSAPEPGFPQRPLTGVSPASPTKEKKVAAVKHAPCGPVFVPVDRGPEAARERIGKKIRARGPHLAFAVSACRPERRPAQSRVAYPVTERGIACQGKSDGVRQGDFQVDAHGPCGPVYPRYSDRTERLKRPRRVERPNAAKAFGAGAD